MAEQTASNKTVQEIITYHKIQMLILPLFTRADGRAREYSKSGTSTSMTLQWSHQEILWKAKAELHFFYKVFTGMGNTFKNCSLFQVGLFTCTHSFTVSIRQFVDPEEKNISPGAGSQADYKGERQSRRIRKVGKKIPFIATAIYLCVPPSKLFRT